MLAADACEINYSETNEISEMYSRPVSWVLSCLLSVLAALIWILWHGGICSWFLSQLNLEGFILLEKAILDVLSELLGVVTLEL